MAYILVNTFILAVVLSFFYFLWQGAIYVPSSDIAIKTIVDTVKAGKRGKFADLGSGDGRVVIALAKKGFEAHGYEINPVLYFISKTNIRKAGLEKKAFVHFRSFWKVELLGFSVVNVFGISHIMKRMENKLYGELRPGAIIIANIFPLPNKKYFGKSNGVYLYRV